MNSQNYEGWLPLFLYKEEVDINGIFSVRRLGDDGGHGPPQRIRLCHASASLIRDDCSKVICDNHGWSQRADNGDSGQESDYENHPGGGRLRKMAGEVN